MAYMSQELKTKLVILTKPILFNYGLKGTFRVDGHQKLILTLKTGKINFQKLNGTPCRNDESLDASYFKKGSPAYEVLTKLDKAMNFGNHDNSDTMTDYSDVGWYTDIRYGTWEEPYIFDLNLK